MVEKAPVVRASNRNKNVSVSEEKVLEMAPKVSTISSQLPAVVSLLLPEEVKLQQSKVAGARSMHEERLKKLKQELADPANEEAYYKLTEIEKDMKSVAGLGQGRPGSAAKELKEEISGRDPYANEYGRLAKEAEAIRAAMPASLLAVIKQEQSAMEKYESEEETLAKLSSVDKKFKEYAKKMMPSGSENKNIFETSLETAPVEAQNELKGLIKGIGISNIDAFVERLKEKKAEAEKALKRFGEEDSEIGALYSLAHETEQYESKSGRREFLYKTAQAFGGFKSRAGQTMTMLDVLNAVDFDSLQSEFADFDKNVILINAIDEALEQSRSGTAKGVLFLKQLAEGDAETVGAYGLSNSVRLSTPAVLVAEAKLNAKETLIMKEERHVNQVVAALEGLTDMNNTTQVKRVKALYRDALVEVKYALPSVFANSLSPKEQEELKAMAKLLENTLDKTAKKLGVTPVAEEIHDKHVKILMDHFSDIANWKEEEFVGRSISTYWQLVQLFSEAYSIKLKDVQETLDEFVRRHLELAAALREKAVEKGTELGATQIPNLP